MSDDTVITYTDIIQYTVVQIRLVKFFHKLAYGNPKGFSYERGVKIGKI